MSKKQITAVILAAGDSSRMGQAKALLDYQGQSFLQSIIQKVQLTGLEKIIVMTGKHDEQIRKSIKNDGTWNYLNNPYPEDGQLSSIRLAISNLPEKTSGILIVLVDHPLVNLSTYKHIIKKATSFPDDIIIPSFKGKKGHPVYFGRKYFSELLNAPINKGARVVVHQNKDRVIRIPVPDAGILMDIDRPQDYNDMIVENINTHPE